MKKRRFKKLQLSRETLDTLSLSRAGGAGFEVAGNDQALSIPRCTWVVSDCKYCTTPIDGCPDPTVA